MQKKNVDVKNSKKTFKGGSLMGPRSGPITYVESDEKGKLTRIRPFNYDQIMDYDSKNPWRIDAHGQSLQVTHRSLPGEFYLAYKKRVYSNNRVKYPLKRVDWDPKGERNTQNRGKSRYVRISWDEATTLIADELKRIKETYGMPAVLAEADMHGEGKHIAPSHGCMNRLLSIMGGYTVQMRNADSWEGWTWGSKHVWGGESVGQMQSSCNVWPDIAKNAELLLFWAADPESTAMGFDGYMSSRLNQWLHLLGLKYVYIDPALNFSACYMADKWIPILPNTDAALYLGIIYTWLKEGTYDKEYVETHAIGQDQFFDYVLGKTDGEPKTPAWASEKCGVSEWTIKALARDWAKKITSVTIGNGGPGIRGPYSSEPARLQSICLGMQGLGKPGRHQAKWLEWNLHTPLYAMPYQGEKIIDVPHRAEIVRPANKKSAGIFNFTAREVVEENIHKAVSEGREGGRYDLSAEAKSIEELAELCKITETSPQQSIPKSMVHDAILKDRIEWYGLYSFCGPREEQFVKYQFPVPGHSRIHAIWTDSPCMTTCWNDSFNFVKAVRSPEIEFIVAQQPWLENDCILADIILPVQTKFEMQDICDDTSSSVFTSVYREYAACPPVGESRNDFDCVAEVARKISPEVYNEYTCNDMPEEKVIELFWQGTGLTDYDKDDDFHKKDIFVMPCIADYQDFSIYPPGWSLFANDPEKHPLSTPSGKLEFTSTGLSEHFPDDDERPPYPKWIEKGETHDESLSSERADKYPLLCMSNHGHWRFHANCDDITWNREMETMKIRGKDGYQYEAAWISPKTAEKCGVKHGDIVKIYNERGTVLCGAYVTERLVDSTVYVDHGARFDPIDAESIDRGGAINLITPHGNVSKFSTGMVVSGFLVGLEKVTDEEMESWKKKYPEAFARKIDEACGVCLEGWMIDDEEAEK